jgi:16S rRNA (uracil1498-N3)-methyltransferase
MPDFRVFCAPEEKQPTVLRLTRDESHHLVAVNRARPRDTIIAFNGRGTEWTCELAEASKNSATLRVLSTAIREPLGFQVMLGQSLPKGQAMESIVRKATEIGAFAIGPLMTERSQVHLEEARQVEKLEKWRTVALEAAKQCGNPWLPELKPVMPLKMFLEASGDIELKLVASLHPSTRSIKAAVNAFRAEAGRLPKTALCLIGPEGDFSAAEVELAVAHGFQPITLGPLVLRCETAAVYALSVLSAELQA